MKQMGIVLDQDLREKIERESERRRCSKAQVVREAVIEFFERRTPSAQVPPTPVEQVQPEWTPAKWNATSESQP